MLAKPSPTLHRLWLGAAALLTLLLTLVIGNFLLPQSKRLTAGMVGHDFLAFYTAGTFVREGHSRDLYDLDKVKSFQHDLARREHLEIGESYGPFWNPPFYAWVFVPLAALPYHAALLTWEAVNAACLFAATLLLIRLLRDSIKPGYLQPTWRVWLLEPILLVTSMPFVQALTHGQNTGVSLLLLCLVVTFWRNRQAVPAGLVAGLLLYKPQLGLLVAVAVALTLGWRAAAALAFTAIVLLAISLITLPETVSDYQARMPGNLILFQVTNVYLWDRHVTLRAFWRLLLQGREPGEMTALAKAAWLATSATFAAALAWAGWHQRKHSPAPADLAPLIAAVIAAMPLLMPFYFDYDLLLISAAAVLYVSSRLQSPTPHPADRWLTPAWVALYLWLMVNSSIARLTGVNGSVLLLSAITALLTWRATGVRPKMASSGAEGISAATLFPA